MSEKTRVGEKERVRPAGRYRFVFGFFLDRTLLCVFLSLSLTDSVSVSVLSISLSVCDRGCIYVAVCVLWLLLCANMQAAKNEGSHLCSPPTTRSR